MYYTENDKFPRNRIRTPPHSPTLSHRQPTTTTTTTVGRYNSVREPHRSGSRRTKGPTPAAVFRRRGRALEMGSALSGRNISHTTTQQRNARQPATAAAAQPIDEEYARGNRTTRERTGQRELNITPWSSSPVHNDRIPGRTLQKLYQAPKVRRPTTPASQARRQPETRGLLAAVACGTG